MKVETVTAKAEEKAVDSIEQTVEKAKIRQDLVGITQQWLLNRERNNKPIQNIRCLSLPAEQWFFEYGLSHGVQNSFFLKNKPTFHFDGVERKRVTAIKSFLNKPVNSTLTGCCFFNEFLKHEVRFNKNGLGLVDRDSERATQPQYEMIWADYCGEATVDMLKDFTLMIRNNVNEGFVAITIKLNSRVHSEKEYRKRFKKYCSSNKLSKAIRVTINTLLHQNVKGKDVRCVYDVVYAGGEVGRSTMQTLVYSVNIPKNALITIKENRRENDTDTKYQSRYSTASKLLKIRRWKVGRLGVAKKEKTPEQIRLESAVARWEKKWDSISKTKKIAIAKKYNVGVRTFGCKVAWYHGKLANKSELKKVA